MTIDNDAPGGEQPDTAATAAPEQSEKVETPAKAETPEAISEEGKQPDTAKTDAEQAAEASEAAKALNRRKQPANERINEITGKYREAERRAERAEARARELEGKLKPPVADDYTDPAKLNADQIAYAMKQSRLQDLKDEHADAAKEADSARALAWFERAEAFKAEHPDFETVAHNAPIGRETSLMVADMEDGPAVAYFLGKNPAKARQIEAMPERARAFELGKIAAQATMPAPRKITTAPTPINSVAGKSGGSSDNPAEMDMDRYVQWRKKGGGGGRH